MEFNERIKGFTLAEVLITLMIIGVVASIVIPGLIADTQQAEYKTAWKKSYSDLNQATKMIMLDNGGDLYKLCLDDYDCIRAQYQGYLNYTKSCSQSQGLGNCFTNNPIKTLNNSTYNISSYASGLILANGTQIVFDQGAQQIGNCWGTGDINGACGYIYVDVNGNKGPNVIGKDLFKAILYLKKISPDLSDNCTTSETGWGCSAKYLYQ